MFQEYILDPNTLAFLLTIVAGFVFVLISKDNDPASVPNKIKVAVVVGIGTLLGLLYLFYLAAIPETKVAVNLVSIVKYVFGGFMMGATAIGINQVWKNFSGPTIPPPGGQPVLKPPVIKFAANPPSLADPVIKAGVLGRFRGSGKK